MSTPRKRTKMVREGFEYCDETLTAADLAKVLGVSKAELKAFGPVGKMYSVVMLCVAHEQGEISLTDDQYVSLLLRLRGDGKADNFGRDVPANISKLMRERSAATDLSDWRHPDNAKANAFVMGSPECIEDIAANLTAHEKDVAALKHDYPPAILRLVAAQLRKFIAEPDPDDPPADMITAIIGRVEQAAAEQEGEAQS
jgi:hypothetical protein